MGQLNKKDLIILEDFLEDWERVVKQISPDSGYNQVDLSAFILKMKSSIWKVKTGDFGWERCECGHWKFEHDETLESCTSCIKCNYYKKIEEKD